VFKTLGQKIILSILLLVAVLAPLGQIAHAQLEAVSNAEELQDVSALPSCLSLFRGTVRGCLGQLLYWAGWWPTHWLAARAGGFLDYFLFYSINSSTYRGVTFEDAEGNDTNYIQEGWEVVRNISNILFVFALLYIGISFVIGTNVGNANPKKLLIYVVIIALIINFSLFITRVVVDAGNILARTLYSQIDLVGRNATETELEGPDGVKPLGFMLISLANPQQLMAAQSQESVSVGGTGGAGQAANFFIMITIGSIIFNLFLIYLFVTMAFFFLGRIVGIYYAMIFSPIAFASLTIPKGSNINFIGFNSWFKNLLGASFMAPLYLFFVYLTVKFLEIGIPINPNVSGGHPVAQRFMSVLIPFALSIAFLIVGKDVAKKMAGEIGGRVASIATKAVTTAAGVGFAGAGMLAGGAIAGGRYLAAKTGATQRLQQAATSGRLRLFGMNLDNVARRGARAALRTGDSLDRMNTDPRALARTQAGRAATSIMGGIAGATGGSLATLPSWTERQRGSSRERREARAERRTQRLDRDRGLFEISGLEAQRRDDAARAHNRGLDPEMRQEYEEAQAIAQRNFQQTDHYRNMNGDEQQQAMEQWRTQFDENYQNGVVEEEYDTNTGQAVLAFDEAAVEANRLATALAALRQNADYQSASNSEQRRLEQLLTTQFSAIYHNATNPQAITDVNLRRNAAGQLGISGTTTEDVTPADVYSRMNNGLRQRRWDELNSQFEQSAWYAGQSAAARDTQREALRAQFHREYNNGNLITNVDATRGTADMANMGQVTDNDEARRFYNPSNYRYMETSAEINRRRRRQYAAELLEESENGGPYPSTTARRTTESYARRNIGDVAGEERSQNQIRQLNMELNDLNDTLNRYYNVTANNQNVNALDLDTFISQVDVDNLSGNTVRDIQRIFDDQTRRQEVNQNFREIIQYLDGQIGQIDAQIQNIQTRAANAKRGLNNREITDIANYNRMRARLAGDRGRLNNGLSQRNQINERINNARRNNN